ncbi:DUF397 domain-containing protein [Phytohabitans suffuscus]|uniref:Toxin n=1 Tax=Phytohabitans suffuscus TaxID=624315 RepID=A0A6F8YQG9_9ACTN|nr:DUF397 domain-containing protein [Phytohabitans suffuscus]BCB88352.1 toxin [Phytohabitans suffuscus]
MPDGHSVLTRAAWHKSSRSAAGDGNCVEVCVSDDLVGIRDSKAEPGGPVLAISRATFGRFVEATKAGLFKVPTGGI